MARQLTGAHWSCTGCGIGEDGYRTTESALKANSAHTLRCRKCPPGHTVSVNGRIVWRKK